MATQLKVNNAVVFVITRLASPTYFNIAVRGAVVLSLPSHRSPTVASCIQTE